MSDCSKHKKEIAGISDMKELAEMIGDLNYETYVELLYHLSSKMYFDAAKDRALGNYKLANTLDHIGQALVLAHMHAKEAYAISKPFMNPGKSEQQ